MPDFLVPAARYSTESIIKGSRFIASIGPAISTAEAKAFISKISQQYPDATHNVPAYIIGYGPSTTAHSSDNGEPSGTAGRPALSVLMGSGLGDTVLVITRYYGGSKLGTGGLVKAYTNAARDAVQGVPKAKKIPVLQATLTCPYNIYESTLRLINLHDGLNIKDIFTDQVQIDFSLPVKNTDNLQIAINELSNGQITVSFQEKEGFALLPVTTVEDINNHAGN